MGARNSALRRRTQPRRRAVQDGLLRVSAAGKASLLSTDVPPRHLDDVRWDDAAKALFVDESEQGTSAGVYVWYATTAAAEAFVQHRGHAYPKDDLLAALFGA